MKNVLPYIGRKYDDTQARLPKDNTALQNVIMEMTYRQFLFVSRLPGYLFTRHIFLFRPCMFLCLYYQPCQNISNVRKTNKQITWTSSYIFDCPAKPKIDISLLIFNSLRWNFKKILSFYRKLRLAVTLGKSKGAPLQAWSGPERSRKLRFPEFMTKAQRGGKVVSLTNRPPLPPENPPGTHLC